MNAAQPRCQPQALGINFEVKSWADTENRQYAGLLLLEPGVAALIKPNYHSDEYDRQTGIAARCYIRSIAAQPPLASRLVQEMPLSAAAQTDDEIVAFYRQNGQPGFYASGTCAMGSDSTASVVDGSTRVHGVVGLRVVDCSIYSEMLSGVTNASIMAIAMRAAERVFDDQRT